MTEATLTPTQRRNCVFARNLGAPVKSYEKTVKNKDTGEDQTALIVEGKPIFRSGTFSDSMGYEHTWETLHINQMVDHAALLSSRDIFSDIPVRKGHPDWGGLFSEPVRNAMDELIGYMSNLRSEERVNPTDGQTYTYLLADLEILEETAIKNIKSGLWRNVSAEVSTYVTNGNAEYWPVMYGVAYVDIPAVEGLKSQHSKAANQYSIILEEDMGTDPTKPQPPVPGSDEKDKPEEKGGAGAQNHSAQQQAPISFTIGGKTTTDFAAVQRHITELENSNAAHEQFKKETLEAARTDFVKGLVASNKINATQEEATIEFAKAQTEENFEAWKSLMEGAPAMQITQPQGAGFAQNHEQVQDIDQKEERIDVLKGIVASHSAGRMSDEQVKQTASYKELVKLDPSFSL